MLIRRGCLYEGESLKNRYPRWARGAHSKGGGRSIKYLLLSGGGGIIRGGGGGIFRVNTVCELYKYLYIVKL